MALGILSILGCSFLPLPKHILRIFEGSATIATINDCSPELFLDTTVYVTESCAQVRRISPHPRADRERVFYPIAGRAWYPMPSSRVFYIWVMRMQKALPLVSSIVIDFYFFRVQCYL